MKLSTLALLFSLGLSSALVAAEEPHAAVVIPHAQFQAAYAKGGTLLGTAHYRIMPGRRTAPGPAEIHEHETDIFYITHGSATLITGGTPIDKTQIGPGEFHADKIEGGTTRELSKGDVVVIPAGVPHWMPKVSDPFDYLVVKVRTN